MLVTITRGKAGRLTLPGTDASMSWRNIFRGNEDLLTGVLFGRMRYLSPPALKKVMGVLLGHAQSDALGGLRGLECWPRLEGPSSRRWVEPDVLLEFSGGAVLVEVKPPFGARQSVDQWKAEISAYWAEAEHGDRQLPNTLYLLALGNTGRPDGEVDFQNDEISTELDVRVYCREWRPFCRALPAIVDSCTGGDAAIIEDWLEAFRLFGISEGLPLDWAAIESWLQNKEISVDHPWNTLSRPVTKRLVQPMSNAPEALWSELALFSSCHDLELRAWS